MTLLPHNATPLERALEAGTARLGAVDAPIAALVDPATVAAELLPWLAYGLSVDTWKPEWSDAAKRRAVAESIDLHRIKGTRASVDRVLARIDALATVLEAQDDPTRLAVHTFEIHVPLVTTPGAPADARAEAAIVAEIIAEVGKVKPLREHLTVVQSLLMTGGVGVQGAARLAGYRRDDATLVTDTSPAWDLYLQSEQGEPLQAEDAAFLDTTP